jgi:hypothetical protein
MGANPRIQHPCSEPMVEDTSCERATDSLDRHARTAAGDFGATRAPECHVRAEAYRFALYLAASHAELSFLRRSNDHSKASAG